MSGKKGKEVAVSTAKIAIWYIISNILAKGLAVLTTPVFTRMMSKSDYGLFSNFTSWESILTVLVTLDLISAVARAKYDFDERMDEYLSSILLFSNIVTLCVYFVIELNQDFFVEFFGMDMLYIRMLFVYLLFMPALNFLQVKHRIYGKYKFSVATSLSSALIRTGISVLLVVLWEDKLLARTVGYLVPITFFNVVLWIIIIAKGRKLSWDCVKYACRISIPMIPHSLSGMLLGNSDRIMITNYCGSEANALYSVAYNISMLAYVIQNSMNQAWSPWLYDHLHIMDTKSIRKNSRIYIGVYAILLIGVLLISPEIIWILGGEGYMSAKYVMPPVILGCAYQFLYTLYVNIEIFQKKTFTISVGTMAAAALNLFLNWLLIPRFGYMAAAYTTLLGYLVLFVFHYLIVRKIAREYGDIYGTKFVVFIMAALTIAAGISLLLYQWNIVRYILIAIYAVVLLVGIYKYRKKLWKLLR